MIYFLINYSIFILKNNMRKKLNDNEKKTRILITIDRKLNSLIESIKNKSKYIETLIYQDLIKRNKIDPATYGNENL